MRVILAIARFEMLLALVAWWLGGLHWMIALGIIGALYAAQVEASERS